MTEENHLDIPRVHPDHSKQDKYSKKYLDASDKFHKNVDALKPQDDEKSKQPAGGYDDTPIPPAPPGYTVKFTFHKAVNLPFADFNSLSSDPYVVATLKTPLPKRHKQDPDLTWRTVTIRKNTNPVWNSEWIVGNVPASGFYLKCRLYDEDPADHDDRLGNVSVRVDSISEQWQGINQMSYKIKKRMASKRAYFFRACATVTRGDVHMSGDLVLSVEVLGKTESKHGGQLFTIGPCQWTKHFSPLIGRLTGTKATEMSKDGKKQIEKYNFQATQIQLSGPVPEHMYHRYVEFKPFVAGMFGGKGIRGRVLNHALHHQHSRIYNYDRSTEYGAFEKPCIELTKKFLEFVHYDQGGRIFTYVITLDGQWRFTETGKEFGIDLLSKHTMHSDVNIYIAFSGEFFVRRLKHPHRNHSISPEPESGTLPPAPEPEEVESESEPSQDPSKYELIIDNDSGTYRPNAKYLPALREFMAKNLPGLKVATLDCQADEERMTRLKEHQRENKKKAGRQITYLQNLSDSSLSSSDEEQLDQIEGNGGKKPFMKTPKRAFMEALNNAAGPTSAVDHSQHDHSNEKQETGQEPEQTPVSEKTHVEPESNGNVELKQGVSADAHATA